MRWTVDPRTMSHPLNSWQIKLKSVAPLQDGYSSDGMMVRPIYVRNMIDRGDGACLQFQYLYSPKPTGLEFWDDVRWDDKVRRLHLSGPQDYTVYLVEDELTVLALCACVDDYHDGHE